MIKKSIISIVFFLIFTGNIYGQKAAILPELTDPKSIKIDNNHIYINEKARIYIYSKHDYSLVRMFGKQGKNPGEFDLGSKRIGVDLNFCLQVDKILATHFEKLSIFSSSGRFLNQMKTPPQILAISRIKDNYIGINYYMERDHYGSTDYILLFDNNFKIIKEIYKSLPGGGRSGSLSDSKVKDMNPVRGYFGYTVYKDKIFIGDAAKGFYIAVFDESGNQLYEINNKYEKLKISEEHKKEETEKLKDTFYWKNFRRLFRIVFPEYFPAFRSFSISDDKIYFPTYRKVNKDREVIITDLHGDILKKIFLPNVKLYAFDEGKYYYLSKNEDNEWELHIRDIKD